MGQVASHLGSGAEIFALFLHAGLGGAAAPGPDQMQPVWDRWNAKSAAQQVQDVVPTDAGFLAQIRALSREQARDWQLDLFGMHLAIADLVRMRLAEHALHTWDIAVMRDPVRALTDDVAGCLIDGLDVLARRVGKPTSTPVTIRITTARPERTFTLDCNAAGATLSATPAPQGPGRTATLELPGEALVRLVYGRLDAAHTPAEVRCDGVELDTLRQVFPGV